MLVDVTLGPLLTFVLATSKKSRNELIADIGIVVAVQLAALSYGLWTSFSARPVYLVHEVDRFQVISPAMIDRDELKEAQIAFQSYPLLGPKLIGVREAIDVEEKLRSLDLALAGKDVAKRPSWWVPFGEKHRAILESRGRTVSSIKKIPGVDASKILEFLDAHGLKEDEVLVFPVVGKKANWSLVLNRKNLELVGYIRVNLFV